MGEFVDPFRNLRALLVLIGLTISPHAIAASSTSACAPAAGLDSICGPVASEDLVRVPGTRWLITSGMNVGQPAHLYLIDTRSKSATVLFPDAASTPASDPQYAADCPGPPDLGRLSTDGLALREGAGDMDLLYAANHGDRMAIEIFAVDAHGSRPHLRWIGCAPLPAGTLPNAVAPLPDGGLLAISFYDPGDPNAWSRMERGLNTGRILEWHAGKGFRDLPQGLTSGGNGLEISADGKAIYASSWSARRLVVLSRVDGSRREIPLDFMPDNIHRLSDGSLLVAGQRSRVAAIHACAGAECPQPWVVAHVDPRSGSVQPLLSGPGTPLVSYACGAVLFGQTLYVTVRGDRRIVYHSLRGTP
jgi:hypothetical protein